MLLSPGSHAARPCRDPLRFPCPRHQQGLPSCLPLYLLAPLLSFLQPSIPPDRLNHVGQGFSPAQYISLAKSRPEEPAPYLIRGLPYMLAMTCLSLLIPFRFTPSPFRGESLPRT